MARGSVRVPYKQLPDSADASKHRPRRLIATLMPAATAAFLGLVAAEVRTDHAAKAVEQTRRVAPVLRPTRPSRKEVHHLSSAPESRAARARIRLVLGTEAEIWLNVRRGSEDGAVLFAGILPYGQAVRASGARIWVRFGGASKCQSDRRRGAVCSAAGYLYRADLASRPRARRRLRPDGP
jgi:hypothetical protein